MSVGRLVQLLWIIVCLATATAARGDISITPAIVIFETRDADKTIVVTNQGKDLAFVTVKVRAVDAPGESDEKLRFEPNPAIVGLLATPNRLVLEPGEQRAIKILAINPAGNSDRVWRVLIAPAVGKLKEGQSGVAFVIAYDALIIQRSAEAKPTVTGRRSGNSLTLINAGNSFAMIDSFEQCRAGNCKRLAGKRLYAGKTWTVQLPNAQDPVTATVEGVSGRKETLHF